MLMDRCQFDVWKRCELGSIGEVELQFSHKDNSRRKIMQYSSSEKRRAGIKRNSLHTSVNKHYHVSHREQV